MTTPYKHTAEVTERVRGAMITWVEGLLAAAELTLPVTGALPSDRDHGALVLLPYQMIMESQAGVPQVPLMPVSGDGRRDAIPGPWRALARGMTDVLVEQFPQRTKGAPGLGPLDPCPPLDGLPAPIAAWYRANPAFQAEGGRGRLPQISWRQPFSLVIRYAAMVVDPDPASDLLRLQALAVLAAGIRQERFFQTQVPPVPQTPDLAGLVDAMAEAAPGEAGETMRAAAVASRSENTLAVGLFPHHDLTDNDLALVMQALQVPMQPALVFGARLSLGAGPVLLEGAVPHLASVEGARR
ncbi:MAG: hypothetical protein KC656_03050 [Myxococcales bacterium]|nr:hypothetical protein [Myxococcales bacterium]MCB9670660.1 hypothetical protein [Alphaproteobacteria bacterium]MCB9693778.1 hypothetical protein [Alphaproteobacteria bacterium]